jgi:hypothetical protein
MPPKHPLLLNLDVELFDALKVRAMADHEPRVQTIRRALKTYLALRSPSELPEACLEPSKVEETHAHVENPGCESAPNAER